MVKPYDWGWRAWLCSSMQACGWSMNPAHLDPATGEQVMHSLREMASGKTLIVATHDPALAALMDRTIALKEVAA